MKFLYAAYLITWSVIIIYIMTMLYGFKKVSEEMHDLER
jgi:CcmD family protein